MKVYDREQKKWVEEDEYNIKLKKRKLCKGGREHDYVEILPYGVEAGKNYAGLTQPYYDAEKAIQEFTDAKYKELELIGIIVKARGWARNSKTRLYVCTVCNKKQYE